MKKLNSILILLGLFLLSCTKDNANSPSGDVKVKLVAQKSTMVNKDLKVDTTIAVMNVDTYNATTGEIKFNRPLQKILAEWKGGGHRLDVYNTSDMYLFTLNITTDTFSSLYNAPVLHYSLLDKAEAQGITTEKDKWYILSGYPYGKVLANDITNSEQLQNFLKIKSNWDNFVEDLKKTGRYTN